MYLTLRVLSRSPKNKVFCEVNVVILLFRGRKDEELGKHLNYSGIYKGEQWNQYCVDVGHLTFFSAYDTSCCITVSHKCHVFAIPKV